MRRLPLLHAALALGLLAGCASAPMPTAGGPDWSKVPPLPKLDAAQQRGQDFALRRCSGCHTVGLDDGGAREGPAFSQLARRYNPISLERRFAEVSAHGFDRMPPVSFTRSQSQDLIAYLDVLRGN
ncbi:MAG: c-type cytochrome [Phenylobacterium sp.]|uniref:c-type cytochrome n=1 Tax=Phenylobacterium sp. TaxID=1871053 RepID=UPI001A5A7F14|nr:c-type cytochrome [Phenylobacterium sp.]MBL8554834.1 c-type cytochrome [Phenylobacterium sp.]